MSTTRHLTIRGRVQGVGYRDAMCRAAADLNVTGWVRNRRDGSVEAMVSGNEESLRAIIAWAHNGPTLAEVASVAVTDAQGQFEGFELLATL